MDCDVSQASYFLALEGCRLVRARRQELHPCRRDLQFEFGV